MNNLTPKQQAFADYYIESGNAEQSAIKAGYSERYARGNAHKLVANSGIVAYMDGKLKEINSKRIMDAQEALELLTSIARGEMEEEVVTPSGLSVTRRADINQRQKAIESLLKRYPMNKHDELKERLLEAQISKVKAETKNEESGANRVVIINDIPSDAK